MIINLTQHPATPEQVAAGVFDLPAASLTDLLTFTALPTPEQVQDRAESLAYVASCVATINPGATQAMIGGAPYLMAPLEWALRRYGIEPVYSFSVRESAEQAQPDGTVRKVATFRHAGFVGAAS